MAENGEPRLWFLEVMATTGRRLYQADDLKLGALVALKFLPQAAQQHQALLERQLAEVRIARQISHPNICRVYDASEIDGQQFLSMEYIDGEGLASLLRRVLTD